MSELSDATVPSDEEIAEYWDTMFREKLIKTENGIDRIADNFMKRRTQVERLLRYKNVLYGSSMLEIGCGLGFIGCLMALLFIDVGKYEAVEMSSELAEFAKTRHQLKVKHGGFNDFKNLYVDKKFDACIIFDVLEHVHPTKRKEAYRSVGRILKDTAYMFIHMPIEATLHKEKFDYGISISDILDLCKETSMEVIEYERYKVNSYSTDKRYRTYGWCVIGRAKYGDLFCPGESGSV